MIDESEFKRAAIRKDGKWYLAWLGVLIVSISIFPVFSASSIIASVAAGLWAFGIIRKSSSDKERLLILKPEIKRLEASGLSEHEAMVKLNVHLFYFDPFWHVDFNKKASG